MKRVIKFLDNATSFGGKAPKLLTRFFRYTASGSTTALLDIILFTIFYNLLGIFYLISVSLSYLISATVNYIIIRDWSFKETLEPIRKSYTEFLSIGIIGITITLMLMRFSVEILELDPLVSRIVVLILVGIFNFTMNYLIAFNMRGR